MNGIMVICVGNGLSNPSSNHGWDCLNFTVLMHLVWFGFFCLMAYQLSWVIQYQSHTSGRTAVMIFNP